MLGRIPPVRTLLSRILVALCAGLLFHGCGGTAPGTRTNVVLVLVDQLRADAADRWLSETRALAERGVRFQEMRSVAPWTYPSVISLFSGLYPQQHGADADQKGTRLTTIADTVPLLPRTLRAAGYHTAAFVTNPFLHEWNRPFRDSFAHFDASFIGDQGPTRGHGDMVWTERMYADSVNAAVRTYFDARSRAEPEFTYVHYIDVHGRKESADRWRDAPFQPSYEAATRFVDGKIRELYDYFTARYGGDVLFVVTSDHGQDSEDDIQIGDGPPWRMRKNSLHDFNLRIPLYVLPSHAVDGPRVVAEPCANVDVAPTLLEWLGLPPQIDGPGRSLLGAIRGQPYDGAARSLYARNSTNGRFEESLVHARHKFMRYRSPEDGQVVARRLYDLAVDPRETRSLARDPSAEERLLEDAAEAHGLVFPSRFAAPDGTTLRQLQELGYGGPAEPAGEPGTPRAK